MLERAEKEASDILSYLRTMIVPNISTGDIITDINTKWNLAFPLCICVNEELYHHTESKLIPENAIIKIEFATQNEGDIYTVGDTILLGEYCNQKDYVDNLDKLKKKILKNKKRFDTNDELKIFIETECDKLGLFPIENCMSYQQFNGKLFEPEASKYIVTNYRKLYNEEDILVQENECFDILKDELYSINLTLIPKEYAEESFLLKIKVDGEANVFKLNDFFIGLKLKNSKMLLSEIKKANNFYAFDIKNYSKYKIGFKECIDNGLLEPFYPKSLVHKHNKFVPVFFKKFTILF